MYLLLGIWCLTWAVAASGFTDIGGHWAVDGIERVVKEGLFAGVSAIQLDPEPNMNRAIFVTMLYRLAGLSPPEVPHSPMYLPGANIPPPPVPPAR